MPHLKCVMCRIRVRGLESPAGGVGELCPGCGSLLEPVRNLSELVGLQERRVAQVTDDSFSVFPEALAVALARPGPDANRAGSR
jgi:hypothetical protein